MTPTLGAVASGALLYVGLYLVRHTNWTRVGVVVFVTGSVGVWVAVSRLLGVS